jgi:hypothetical protein
MRLVDATPTAFFSLDRDWLLTYLDAGADHSCRDGARSSREPVSFAMYAPAPVDTWFDALAAW